MIIGILSDTHGRLPAVAAGLRALQDAGAEYFIHCGDIGSAAVLDHLAGLPSAFVLGNTDWDPRELERYAAQLQIRCLGRFGELTLDGKNLAVIHGDDFRLKNRLLMDQKHDYLLQGHTHVPEEQQIGRIHLINPGALYRATQKTVALLDTRQPVDQIAHAGQGGPAVRFLTVPGI